MPDKVLFSQVYVSLGQKACKVCEKRSFGSSKNAIWFLKEANLVSEKVFFRSYEDGKTFAREQKIVCTKSENSLRGE